MSIVFDFYETPVPNERKALRDGIQNAPETDTVEEQNGNSAVAKHARPIPRGTANTDDIVSSIVTATTMTRPDVVAALAAFQQVLRDNLSQGRRVHLEGLGYFSIKLSSPPIYNTRYVHAEQVKATSINFKPDAPMKQIIRKMKTERMSTAGLQKHNSHTPNHDEETVRELLQNYLSTHGTIDRAAFQTLTAMKHTKALTWLRRLREEGIIENISKRNSPLYRLAQPPTP